MWRFRTVRVAEHQRAVWFRDGNFEGILTPGRYRFYKPRTEVTLYGEEDIQFSCPGLRHLMSNRREALEQHLKLIDLNDNQIALLRINGVAREILSPGSVSAFWTHAQKVDVDVDDYKAGAAVPAE